MLGTAYYDRIIAREQASIARIEGEITQVEAHLAVLRRLLASRKEALRQAQQSRLNARTAPLGAPRMVVQRSVPWAKNPVTIKRWPPRQGEL
jgi:hypothetical protein